MTTVPVTAQIALRTRSRTSGASLCAPPALGAAYGVATAAAVPITTT